MLCFQFCIKLLGDKVMIIFNWEWKVTRPSSKVVTSGLFLVVEAPQDMVRVACNWDTVPFWALLLSPNCLHSFCCYHDLTWLAIKKLSIDWYWTTRRASNELTWLSWRLQEHSAPRPSSKNREMFLVMDLHTQNYPLYKRSQPECYLNKFLLS